MLVTSTGQRLRTSPQDTQRVKGKEGERVAIITRLKRHPSCIHLHVSCASALLSIGFYSITTLHSETRECKQKEEDGDDDDDESAREKKEKREKRKRPERVRE